MKLYLASGNLHKVQEMRALAAMSPLELEIVGAAAIGGMPKVVEDTGTFHGNSRKKAEALRALAPTDGWVLADDSGLCVDALGGAPGVESAYFAGLEADPVANLQKLITALHDVPQALRTASFVCVFTLLGPQRIEQAFEGRCRGSLTFAARGTAGFGYDSIFIPEGNSATFAELAEEEKNRISHRSAAWTQAIAWLQARKQSSV